jgi:hypothetical protein
LGLATGLGALWQRQDNYPDVRPQYTMTPKINPSLALNYRTNKINAFVQVDNFTRIRSTKTNIRLVLMMMEQS